MYINKSLLHFSSIVFIVTLFGCRSKEALINLDSAKNAVRDYYESGKYDAECKQIVDRAISEIENLNIENNSVVIFDVDDTALSNYDYTKKMGFGYYHPLWNEWINSGNSKAVPQVKRFYNWILLKNIKVIFLTGRKAETYSATKKNLVELGFTKFDTLIVRREDEINLTASEFKSIKRKELTERGYNIIANIGDQPSDLIGAHTGIKIKLPNYLYYID